VKKVVRRNTVGHARDGSAEFPGYENFLCEIAEVLNAGKRQAAWSLNTIMSAVYWDIGRRIVEFEQLGRAKAEYGERLIAQLTIDLHARFGRGFRKSNLYQFRKFYLTYRDIFQTLSGKFGLVTEAEKARAPLASLPRSKRPIEIFQTVSGKSLPGYLAEVAKAFVLRANGIASISFSSIASSAAWSSSI
jgi:hypothetical protein